MSIRTIGELKDAIESTGLPDSTKIIIGTELYNYVIKNVSKSVVNETDVYESWLTLDSDDIDSVVLSIELG